jgi:3-oxoadipate enol-lactonase
MPFVTVTDDTRVHWTEWGDPEGDPVLFIHGLGADNLGWVRQRRAFSGYRCIAVDNRGSGRSDKPDGPYDLTRLALDAVEVLDDAGVDRAHVIGASMGGALTQIIGALHPERARTLTLACTACELQGWRAELFDGWIDLIETKGMRAFAIENLQWIFGPRSLRRLYPVAAALGPLLLRAPRHGFLGQVEALRNVDPAIGERLGEVTAPTLVLTGSQDILTPVADAEEIASRIPGSELVVIRGAAHGFMVESAGVFNEVVLDFLERHRDA